MYKCSFHKCGKELSVDKREVFAKMFFRLEVNTEGVKQVVNDGHQWLCKEHFLFVGRIRKPFVSLLKGERYENKQRGQGERRHFKGFHKRKNTTNGKSVQTTVTETKS